MKLESGFVPVALSTQIEKGTSAGAVVEGAELVVWRDNSGKAHVWEDRCPHRGMRLSFGFVRGDHIACLYHGWQYDTAGQCRLIPAHPDLDVPQTIKVPTNRTEEKYGIVWATSSAEATLPAIDSPDLTPFRSLYIDCALEDVLIGLGGKNFSTVGENIGTLVAEGVSVLVALQVAGPQRSALHMVALAKIDAGPLKRLARWAEDFRFSLETPALATAEVA
jgi:phenylpropionate dioxygenase-like ring-hydroxylating dioxygenase large terminal subunit